MILKRVRCLKHGTARLARKQVAPTLFSGKIDFCRQFSSVKKTDDFRLIDFTTLHELQRNACETFASNKLFGTYSPASGNFAYLSYADVEKKINHCRSLLRNIGEFS